MSEFRKLEAECEALTSTLSNEALMPDEVRFYSPPAQCLTNNSACVLTEPSYKLNRNSAH